MIIAIDGPIATGKSSIAKALAKEIGFIYFDTGAMYRCLTYGILKNNIDIEDEESLKNFLNSFKLDIKIKFGERYYYVEGEDITDVIRGKKVTFAVSKVAANKFVREKLVASQRDFAKGVNSIFEGRDIATTVFPEADLKIFLTGSPEVRAQRRYDELKSKYPEEFKDLTMEQALENLNRRDAYDASREISPLRQADDAHVIDTSNFTIEEIVFKILEIKDALSLE